MVSAYSLLKGTTYNCAGGATPWGTWLSCEEFDQGKVYQCDIFGRGATICKGLGTFTHEAVAVDPINHVAYLTEDTRDGCFYRYSPSSVNEGIMDLNEGALEVAAVDADGRVTWLPLENPNPGPDETATRFQVEAATKFKGGEGIAYHEGNIYFTTKGDDKVWQYQIESNQLSVLYHPGTTNCGTLKGVDNVVVTKDGHILVAEDGGNMQIVVIGPWGDVYPLLQVVGQNHSEITGPSIVSNGSRMYFSSQRGGTQKLGITYEVRGSFHT